MLLSLTALLAGLRERPAFWRRLLRGALLTLWLGFGLWTWPWFLRVTFQGGANYAAANREAAYHLKAMPQQGSIAVEDAGLLAYYSGRETVDLLGVTDHRFALAQKDGATAVLHELQQRRLLEKDLVAVLHPQRTGSYSQIWTQSGILKPVTGLGNMVLYQFAPEPKARRQKP
jgi:hypothetical protein